MGQKTKFLQTEKSFPEFRKTLVTVVYHFAETCSLRKMSSSRLRTEDRLDGAGNFVPWKARILLVLKENELWDEVVNHTTTHPIVIPSATTDPVALVAFEKKDIKAMKIILDAVKDHVIPHISGKDHAHEMWSALTGLFQSLMRIGRWFLERS